jgi:hypothetical protein
MPEFPFPIQASLGFASPWSGLLVLAVALPLAALYAMGARATRIRAAIGLPEPTGRLRHLPMVLLLLGGGLVGLAAAQPVIQRDATRFARTDAEAWVVIDTTRSMLAQRDPDSPMRLDRAKDVAEAVRQTLPDVPVGIASLTDRVLPHLFPTVDADVFRVALDKAIGVENPPPQSGFLAQVTRLDAIGKMNELNFFSPTAERRVIVVVTDGESLPYAADQVAGKLRGPPEIQPVLVHVWNAADRVFTRGVPEPQYRPDGLARPTMETLATITGSRLFTDGQAGQAAAEARALIGDGPTLEQGERRVRHALSPYLAAAAFLPFGLLLARRDR